MTSGQDRFLEANGRHYAAVRLAGLDGRFDATSLTLEAGSPAGLRYALWAAGGSTAAGRAFRKAAVLLVPPKAVVLGPSTGATHGDRIRQRGVQLLDLGSARREKATDIGFGTAKAAWAALCGYGAWQMASGAAFLSALGAPAYPAYFVASVLGVGAVVGIRMMEAARAGMETNRRLVDPDPFRDIPEILAAEDPGAGPGEPARSARPALTTSRTRTQMQHEEIAILTRQASALRPEMGERDSAALAVLRKDRDLADTLKLDPDALDGQRVETIARGAMARLKATDDVIRQFEEALEAALAGLEPAYQRFG